MQRLGDSFGFEDSRTEEAVWIVATLTVFAFLRSCLAPDFPLDLLACTHFVLLTKILVRMWIDVWSLRHAWLQEACENSVTFNVRPDLAFDSHPSKLYENLIDVPGASLLSRLS